MGYICIYINITPVKIKVNLRKSKEFEKVQWEELEGDNILYYNLSIYKRLR